MEILGGHGRVGLLERAFSDAVNGAADDEANAAVLDAARDLFSHHGFQRTTMDDVARRAQLSRITVYRRVGSKEALVELVVLREFRRYLDQFILDIARAGSVADRVAVGFVSSLRVIRSNPLISMVMADPELAFSSVVGQGGHTLAVVGQFLAGQLRQEQSAGHVPPGVDVDLVAEMMVRISTSFLLTPGLHVDVDDDRAMDAVARRFLVPMLGV